VQSKGVSLPPGKRVRYWRVLRGIDQRDLAKDADIDAARLCRIELGKTEPKAGEIERLAAALDLSMPEFYGAIDEAKAS
jgi:transcriptional regulator with XRE-family HTH domain